MLKLIFRGAKLVKRLSQTHLTSSQLMLFFTPQKRSEFESSPNRSAQKEEIYPKNV